MKIKLFLRTDNHSCFSWKDSLMRKSRIEKSNKERLFFYIHQLTEKQDDGRHEKSYHTI